MRFAMMIAVPFGSIHTQGSGNTIDWLSPIACLILSITGILFIYSAQSTISDSDWKKQVIWVLMGVALYIAVSRINYKFFFAMHTISTF